MHDNLIKTLHIRILYSYNGHKFMAIITNYINWLARRER